MKKRFIYMLTALAAALVTVGCSNAFTGSDFSGNRTAEYASGNRNVKPLKVSINSSSFTKNTTDAQLITLKFELPISSDSLSGITLYSLTGASSAADAYSETLVTPDEIVRDNADPSIVYIKAILDADAYEVEVDPSIVTALNGQKLDQDGDCVQGETDDDVACLYTVSATLTGIERNPQGTLSSYIFSPSFSKSTSGVVNGFQIVMKSINGVAFSSKVSEIKTLLGQYLKVQEYDAATSTWSDVALSFQLTDTDNVSNAETYTAAFNPSKPYEYVRYVVTDMQNFVTTSRVAGSVLKYTTDAYSGTTYTDTPEAAFTYNDSQYIKPAATSENIFGSSSVTDGKIVLTMSSSLGSVSWNTSSDIVLYPWKKRVQDNGTYTYENSFNGLDETTVTADNVKVADSNGNIYTVSSVTLGKSVPTMKYDDQVIIQLKDTTVSSVPDIYFNANVKTAAAKGYSYNTTTYDYADVTAQYGFGTLVPASGKLTQGGWQKVN